MKVVKEKSSDEVFALKILKKSEMKSQKNVAFFEEERDILAAGDYPRVILYGAVN